MSFCYVVEIDFKEYINQRDIWLLLLLLLFTTIQEKGMETQWMKEDKSTFKFVERFLGMEEQSTQWKFQQIEAVGCLDPTHTCTHKCFLLF